MSEIILTRKKDTIADFFKEENPDTHNLIMLASSDRGVRLNLGKRGTQWGAQTILHHFTKLQKTAFSSHPFLVTEVADAFQEEVSLEDGQKSEALNITKAMAKTPKASVHLGGGHDHIFPLLKSYANAPKIVVLNIDAHTDTRTDSFAHSGNPFRKFANAYQGDFHLFQLGIQRFANSPSTLSPLERGSMTVLYDEEVTGPQRLSLFLNQLQLTLNDQVRFILSIDTDALNSSDFSAVSAVNPQGLKLETVLGIIRWYKEVCPHENIMGIYEYNPLFDDLHASCAKKLALFLYEFFKRK